MLKRVISPLSTMQICLFMQLKRRFNIVINMCKLSQSNELIGINYNVLIMWHILCIKVIFVFSVTVRNLWFLEKNTIFLCKIIFHSNNRINPTTNYWMNLVTFRRELDKINSYNSLVMLLTNSFLMLVFSVLLVFLIFFRYSNYD